MILFLHTVWVQRQLASRTTPSASVWQLPGPEQTEMGMFRGSSAAWVPTFCEETAANKQKHHEANTIERMTVIFGRSEICQVHNQLWTKQPEVQVDQSVIYIPASLRV